MGLDGIPYKLVKMFGINTIKFLTTLFNECMRQGAFPRDWTIAKIIALNKESGGFRPISLLSCISKLYERLVYSRFRYLPQMKKLTNHALAGGTSAALKKFFSFCDNQSTTYAAFFDVKKAYDRVCRSRLIHILRNEYRLPMYIQHILEEFLTDRTAFVDSREYGFTMQLGLPQGSVLSPILFALYIEAIGQLELPEIRGQFKVITYADDILLLAKSAFALELAFSAIVSLAEGLRLSFDQVKTKLMILGKMPRHRPKLSLNDVDIEFVDCYKYLGVIVDRRRKFTKLVKTKIDQCHVRTNLVSRLRLPLHRSQRLYKGFVESYLRYGLRELWPYLSNTSKTQLDRLQTYAARRLSGLTKFTERDVSLDIAGLDHVERLINEGTSGKKIIELPMKNHEVVYLRWRSGFVYTNARKALYNIGDVDSMCRFCHLHDETIDHLLMACEAIADRRFAFLSRVATLLQCDLDSLSTRIVLGLDLDYGDKCLHRNLARLLYLYTESIDLHI